MAEYYIPNHVHFALEGDIAVFMNLRSDKYSMFMGAKARTFRALVSRNNDYIERVIHLDPSTRPGEASALQDEVLTELLADGLLTAKSSDCTRPIPAFILLPRSTLLDPQPDHGLTPITARQIWTFLISCAIAKWRLSCWSIEHTVRAVAQRKRLLEASASLDIQHARTLLHVYNRLRPLIPHDYLCLFDSLSLIEFMARNGCYPNWVFAVQFEPWGAHCWVQYDDIAFNETAHEARAYLPILSI